MQKARYRIQVRATDWGSPALHADVDVELEVVDRNNKPPLWEQQVYGPIYVKENAPQGEIVTSVRARFVYPPRTNQFLRSQSINQSLFQSHFQTVVYRSFTHTTNLICTKYIANINVGNFLPMYLACKKSSRTVVVDFIQHLYLASIGSDRTSRTEKGVNRNRMLSCTFVRCTSCVHTISNLKCIKILSTHPQLLFFLFFSFSHTHTLDHHNTESLVHVGGHCRGQRHAPALSNSRGRNRRRRSVEQTSSLGSENLRTHLR